MAAKKTAKELRQEARARYQQALLTARKVEEREKLALGDELKRAAEELGTEPEELLKRIKTAAIAPTSPDEKAASDETDEMSDETETDDEHCSD